VRTGALAVQEHQLTYLDGLDEVALLLDEAGLARSVSEGLILERALATLVTDRAVEGVVREQELEHAVLGFLHLLGIGAHAHAVVDVQVARGLQRRATRSFDFDEAHAAHSHRLHARVVAETWDVLTRSLGGVDQQFTGLHLDLSTVDGDVHRGAYDVSHGDTLREARAP
jgi:hypothetical protein